MRFTFCALTLCACFIAAPYLPAEASTSATEERIRLGSFFGRPLVDVTIAGKGPYSFILDTGADVTVIDQTLARELQLEKTGKTEIGSPLGGTVPADRLRLENVDAGGFDMGSIEALAIDLASVLGSGDAPVGVLSTTDFGARALTFDFGKDELLVSKTLLPEKGANVFSFCVDTVKPSLEVDVAGEDHCVVVDTGSPALLSLPLATAETLKLSEEPSIRGKARLVGTEVDVWGAQLAGSLRVGSVVIPKPEVGFVETAPYGNMGQGFLQHVLLTVDHTNRRLRVQPGGDAPKLGPNSSRAVRQVRQINPNNKSYGIRLNGPVGGDLSILSVVPGSPAEAGGIQGGDRIVRLNGVAVEELDQEARVKAFRGSPLKLQVERDGGTRDFELTLQ